MKKSKVKICKKDVQKLFYKTNPRGGISLIVLVITIIVVIILAAAVIISLQNNNPMVEANEARIKSDVANMQSIFTNTVGKIMAENQDMIQVEGKQLNSVTTGVKKAQGETTYKINGVVEGKIIFGTGEKSGTTYYTGKELPLYGSDTKWSVDNQGLLSVEVGGVTYGEGEEVEEDGEEIVESEKTILKYWASGATTDFHAPEYKSKITKIIFTTTDEVSDNKIESWDVSQVKDKSVMAWIEDDGNNGYILTIAGKNKIIANPNSSYLFSGFNNVKEIANISTLDTSQVTNMQFMFCNCFDLTSLDLRNFNTEGVTNMKSMFNNCRSLTSLNLNSFNTEKVTSMESMFTGCDNLTNLNISSFNTSNVSNMKGMFWCGRLTTLTYNKNTFITSNVYDMSSMFYGCKLVNLDLSNFNTEKVKNMEYMFANCINLTNLDLSSFNTSKVTDMSAMFNGCSNLENLNIANFDTSNVTNMKSMFLNCTKMITTLNIKGNTKTYESMFKSAAEDPSAKIVLNYTSSTSSLVDGMIATKSPTSNVVKGVQI